MHYLPPFPLSASLATRITRRPIHLSARVSVAPGTRTPGLTRRSSGIGKPSMARQERARASASYEPLRIVPYEGVCIPLSPSTSLPFHNALLPQIRSHCTLSFSQLSTPIMRPLGVGHLSRFMPPAWSYLVALSTLVTSSSYARACASSIH
jgi:hypothetical protein